MDWDKLLFNTAVFAAGVFMLDYGADKFIDHTVIVGQRLGVSQTLIAVLTAGAEYEELAVVIAAVLQKQSPLALGNVMGSTISNVLGAFSLGLLLHPGSIVFDPSAKVYTALLFSITTAFSILVYFNLLNKVTGGVLVATFLVYMICTCYAIHKGVMEPPEASDSDSDSDNDTSDDEHPYLSPRPQGNIVQDESETSPLLTNEEAPTSRKRAPRSLFYHISQLVIGLLALTISGYLLSRSASAIADCFHLSGTLVGLTVVSFATTLPEKMIAIISGSRGHSGIVVASTAGSNIFLLTLCAGVIGLAELPTDNSDRVLLFEVFSTWVSSVMLFLAVFVSANRAIGALFLVMYVAFLIFEFTVYRR